MSVFETFVVYLNKQSGVSNIKHQDGHSIYFDKDNLHYYFYHDYASDPYYFRLMLPIVDNITDDNRTVFLERCVKVSTDYKVGKAIVLNGNQIWFSVEEFLYDLGDNVILLFDRMLLVLQLMYNSYKEIANGSNNQGQK